MRPIKKLPAPRQYKEYQDAKDDLVALIGSYCSYCGRKIPNNLAVEHKQPKSLYPNKQLDWDNFLLACSNCNSTKKDKKIKLSNYIWPDQDNSFRAFECTVAGVIRARTTISKKLRRKANRTIHLLGLDKLPGNQFARNIPSKSDSRWLNRQQQWEKAIDTQTQLKEYDTPAQRDLYVKFAQDGIFVIWMEVFKDDIDMKRRLIQAFPGTALDCFDSNCHPIPRQGGCL